MRKSVVTIVIALIAALILPTTSSAAPKAGAKCTKKGKIQVYKSYEYKCVKKSGKLVWSKGQFKPFGAGFEVSVPSEPWPTISPTPKPTPTPEVTPSPVPTPTETATPTPTPSPTQTKSELDVRNLSILENSWSQISGVKPSSNKSQITYFIDPKFPKASLEAIKTGVDLTFSKFGYLFKVQRPIYVILSTSLAFELDSYRQNELLQMNYLAEDKNESRYKWRIEHYQLIDSGLKDFVSGGAFNLNDPRVGLAGFFMYFRMHPDKQDPTSILLGAHESSHLLQWQMNSDFPHLVPAWWIEGQVQMIGEVVASQAESFEQFESYLKSHKQPTYGGGFFSGSTNLAEMEGDPVTRSQFDCKLCSTRLIYSRGKVGMHYLTYKFGFEKVVAFMGTLNRSNRWWQSFEKTFGMSVETFYKEVDQYARWFGDYFSPGWERSQF